MSAYQQAVMHSGDTLPPDGDDSFIIFFKTATDAFGSYGLYFWDGTAWVFQRSENRPVGSIYTSVDPTDPATIFGYGTWVAFGAGRVLVGLDAGQPEFDTVEGIGGEKTHTLTVAEMPSHTHSYNGFDSTNSTADVTGTTDNAIAGTTGATGGDGAHNNLQPYIVVYMWKRTA